MVDTALFHRNFYPLAVSQLAFRGIVFLVQCLNAAGGDGQHCHAHGQTHEISYHQFYHFSLIFKFISPGMKPMENTHILLPL